MIGICKSLLFVSLLLLVYCSSNAQEPVLGNVPDVHPRLFMLKGEEEQIKKKIKADQFLETIHKSIIRKSDSFLKVPLLQPTLIGQQMLKVSRTALTYIYYLSYSYRMTGDKKYAERAKKELQNVCRFKEWNPDHFLDVAEMTTAVSIGYDWLYSYLDKTTKSEIEQAILTKGLYESLPEKATKPSNYSWLKKKNNWNSVCNASMAIGALAIYQLIPDMAKKIISRSIVLVRDVAMAEYLPDGNYPEGYTYWSYGTTYNLFLIDVLEKIYGNSFGLGSHPGFKSTPEYILQMSTQDLGCYAYSDCFDGYTFSFPMFWFASHNGDRSMLWGESEKWNYMKKTKMNDDDIFNVRYLPAVMSWASPQPFKQLNLPQKRLYVGQGTTPVAIIRNHWGGNDEIFAGLKGGSCSTNHSHMDIGSFVMYKGKNHWVTDLGAQDYYSLEKYGFNLSDRSQLSDRWDAMRLSNKLHNVVMFNGAKQNVNAKAKIDAFGERPDFVFAASDLTNLDSSHVKKHERGIAIVNNSYVVVRDEIQNGPQFTDLRWAMLTPASIKIIDDRNAELVLNGEKMRMKVEGQGVKIATWDANTGYSFDEKNEGTMLGFTALLTPSQSSAFTVYLIPENATIKNEQLLPIEKWKQ